MFGGVEKRHSDGIRVRGDIHALIVGDPGTAKSQLLRYVSEVAPRAIYTSGKGATAAGLTAAAVKDDFAGGRWVLEAGMLVLADGGMAVIDELDKMSPEDRSAMHEALEQQSMHPEFELMFLNGEKRPIGEFVDDLIQRHPERVIPGKDCEILPLEGEKFSLLTTDFHGLRGVVVDRVSRHQAPPRFLRVTYGNGRALRVTPEHPVFVWRAGGWQTVPAEQVCVGDLAPGVSEYPRALNEAVLRAPDLLPGGNGITFPTEVGPELSRLIGYLLSRGHVPGSIDATPSEIRVRATDLDLAADLSALFSSTFGVETLLQLRKPSQSEQAPLPLYDVRAVSPELLRYFQENFPELARKASEKRVPGALFHATEECRTQFLLGAYRGDGFYDSERFGFATGSEGLARDYSDLLLSLGVYTDIESSSDRQGRDRTGILVQVVVSGAQSQRRFLDLVAGRTTTASRIRKIVEQSESHPMDSDRFPKDLVDRVELLLKELGLGKRPTHRPQGNRLRRSSLATGLRAAENRLAALPTPVPAGRSWMDLRELYHLSRRAIADRVGRSPTWVSAQSLDRGSPPGRELLRATQELAQEKISWATEEIRELTDRVNSPLRFVPVRKVESIPNSGEKWVYDVTVEPTHTFVSEGLVLHNTVSIAKAGITSTLNARCPVLAAANPKWGRFSPDRTIAEQIDLPPTLLSRFDVIFSIQDHPNQEKDRRLAHGILASHREGEVSGLPGGKAVIESAPFPTDLLKKYIAYARRTVRPVLTSGALVELEDFYVRVRRQGEEPNSPVPITARQLEALVRLSEAAARARLSPDADVEDARRAIQIMENFLKRVSTAEDGKLDIDLAQSGVSHSQRERLDIVMRVMRELQEEGGGTFTMEMFRTATERAGIAGPKAEALLLSLRNQGEVIEPRANQYQLVRF
jgi:replicative DNA helicase Mcm